MLTHLPLDGLKILACQSHWMAGCGLCVQLPFSPAGITQIQRSFKYNMLKLEEVGTYSGCHLFFTCSLPFPFCSKSSFCGRTAGPTGKIPALGMAQNMLPHHPSWAMLEGGSINTAVYKTFVVVSLFRDCRLLHIHNAGAKERYSTYVFSYCHVVIRQLDKRDYWVFGLCPMSSILRSTIFLKLDFSQPQMKVCKAPTLFGPLERADLCPSLSHGQCSESKNLVI